MTNHYFRCNCTCAVVSIGYIDWDCDSLDNEVSLRVYGEYHAGLKDRLRHIWSIIKYGHPHSSNELLLSLDEATRMGNILIAEARQETL